MLSATCLSWWNQWCTHSSRGDDLPGEKDLELLTELLQADVARAVMETQKVTMSPRASHGTDDGESQERYVSHKEPMTAKSEPTLSASSKHCMTTVLPTIDCEFSKPTIANLNISTKTVTASGGPQNQDDKNMMAFATPEDKEDAERLMQSLSQPGQSSQSNLLVGQEAARSLIAQGLAVQRVHAQKVYRHGRKIGSKSKPLEVRVAEQVFDHHEPTESAEDFATIGVLFRILLTLIQQPKFYNRFEEIPLAAKECTEFHRLHAKKFLQRCKPPWQEMHWDAKQQYLLAFLTEVFIRPKTEVYVSCSRCQEERAQ